ncbi:MAG: PAS domain S-box protein [Sphingomonadales bacterium]|nr:PAS domain S-box protein [Sphingomonadales bacterium]
MARGLPKPTKDGTSYWAETTIFPLTDDDGVTRNFIGIGEDITEKRQGARAGHQGAEAGSRGVARGRRRPRLQQCPDHDRRGRAPRLAGRSPGQRPWPRDRADRDRRRSAPSRSSSSC